MKYFLQCPECLSHHEILPRGEIKLPTIARKIADGPMPECCGKQLQKEFRHTKAQKGDAYTIVWR